MYEKNHLTNPQKINATLARFYDWVKQREKPADLPLLHKTPVAKIDKEKSDASYTF